MKRLALLTAVVVLSLGLVLGLVLLWQPAHLIAAPGTDAYHVYYVSPGGNCAGGVVPCYSSLQAAVDAADEVADEIRVAAGVYTGVHARGGLTQAVYVSKTVTIRGGYGATFSDPPNPEANPTTLDAQGQGRVMYITGDISPTIEGLRLTGGQGAGVYVVTATALISHNHVLSNAGYGLYLYHSDATLDGNLVTTNTNSGVYLDYSPAVLKSNTLAYNKAGYGGGLYLRHSRAMLRGNTISNNRAGQEGGGLFLLASPAVLEGNTLSLNSAGHDGGGGVLDNSPAVLDGNTILRNSASYNGGGLYVVSSSPTLRGNTILSNTASVGGGGVSLDRSHAILEGNTVAFNGASYWGGGVELYLSPATLVGNTIASNRAGTDGGGIQLDESEAVLTANIIAGNRASYGGGVHGNSLMSGNVISNNIATADGGGVCGSSTLDGNSITHNTASRNGGGVYGSNVLMGNSVTHNTAGRSGGGVCGSGNWTDNVIADNQAGGAGSGLYISARSHLLHTTIARNRATGSGDGSGVYVSAGPVAMTNTILVSHTTGIVAAAGVTVSLEATLWGSQAWANLADLGGTGAIVSGTTNIWDIPGFVGDAALGDYHIASFSPARDVGVDAGVERDVDGQPRPMDRGYDLGADEYPGAGLDLVAQPSAGLNRGHALTYTLVVSSAGTEDVTAAVLTDTLDGWQAPVAAVTSVGGCSLVSNGFGGSVVCALGALAPGAEAVITLTTQLSTAIGMGQTITNAVVVAADETANDALLTNTVHDCHARLGDDPREYTSVQAAVDAAAPGELIKVAGTCLGVSQRDGRSAQVHIDKSLTIRGGYTTTLTPPGMGWASPDPLANPTTLDAQGRSRVLYVLGNEPLVVEGLHITGGDPDSSRLGGGIYAVAAALTISRCTLLHNVAGEGSALFAAGGVVTLTDNIITANDAYFGGAVSLSQSAAVLSHNTISSNTAEWVGGIFSFVSTAMLEDNTISANAGSGVRLDCSTATLTGNVIRANYSGYGGGVWLYLGDVTMISNTIASNQAGSSGGGVYYGEQFRAAAYLFDWDNIGGPGVKRSAWLGDLSARHLYRAKQIAPGDWPEERLPESLAAGDLASFQLMQPDRIFWCDKQLTLIGNTILANVAWEGGGVSVRAGTAHLNGNTIVSNTATSYGGGVYDEGNNVTFTGNTIAFNNARYGGGGVDTRTGKLVSNTIFSNTALQYGGGVDGGSTLTGNTIAFNTAEEMGGGIFGADMVVGNAIYSNTARTGGGVGSVGGMLVDNIIRDNAAQDHGGGVYWWGGMLSGNTVTGNTAGGNGGGVYGAGTLTNNVIAGNRAGRAGSGLSLIGASRLLHNTIARNAGSGLYVDANVAMANTILVSHTVGLTVTAGHTVTLEGTLWGADEWANRTDWGGPGAVISGTRNAWSVPGFAAPERGDYHLRYTSPAIDAGLDAGVADDIDGDMRPAGDGYDLGADEFQPAPAIELAKRVTPGLVHPGQRLGYTIYVTNAGNIPLHAAVTDTLPTHITSGTTPGGTVFVPGGLITWTNVSLLPGSAWVQAISVTSEAGYVGPLLNVVQVTSWEGATAVYTATSRARLPNRAPYTPSNPVPADGAREVSWDPVLTWQGGDPDAEAVTYTVAFGASTPPLLMANATITRYDPGMLNCGVTYYWRITATDGVSTSVGALWSFTTTAVCRVYLPLVLRQSA
ncbi:MAG: right-handed parallel beta-helix repeat-containing protein [Thermoflexales bacterium]|nr:right-handed parallel beta-helix repeat-containing protein [Thermoflexales bacterium]